MTDEQREILRYLAEGHTIVAIARHLGLGERTIRRRLGRLLRETGCRSHTQLAVWAVAWKFVEPTWPALSRKRGLELCGLPPASARRLSGELRAAVGNQPVDDIDVPEVYL